MARKGARRKKKERDFATWEDLISQADRWPRDLRLPAKAILYPAMFVTYFVRWLLGKPQNYY